MKKKWPYRNIPVKPELHQELQGLKSNVEKDIGVRFDWNSFILGLLGGAAGTALGIAIGKAIKKYQQEKKGGKNQ